MYQRLTAKIAGTPEERILSFLMLRSLKQARYSAKRTTAISLSPAPATHTSPAPFGATRTLIIHRLLRAALRAGADPFGGPILSTDPQPWSGKRQHAERNFPCPIHGSAHRHGWIRSTEPIPLEELASIALESSRRQSAAPTTLNAS